ncbi:hypothetical protein EV652_12045 [Kribbella steppae]|uniref:Uncharacterized protein n=1 Tax=Kribbella steppae TaxID=2512223 RepID=A0A4R2GYM2_9ACTN|nr:hypothetical protein EV652_12045 [Kribbella steppae]
MGAQWDGFRASRDRTTHGLGGDFVRPGGTVGLLLACAVVGLPGGVVGDPVTGVVGAIVGVGTTVGVLLGTGVLLEAGVLVGSVAPSGVTAGSFGRSDCTAADPGVTSGFSTAGLPASGNGTSGVSRLGPPSRLLTSRIR